MVCVTLKPGHYYNIILESNHAAVDFYMQFVYAKMHSRKSTFMSPSVDMACRLIIYSRDCMCESYFYDTAGKVNLMTHQSLLSRKY